MYYAYELKSNFSFSEEERKAIKTNAEKIVEELKRKNLTYAEAMAVLEQSKVFLEMSVIK